jgi:hypothetical protein
MAHRLEELLDAYEQHLLKDHPDPDMTQPCEFKKDVASEIRELVDKILCVLPESNRVTEMIELQRTRADQLLGEKKEYNKY